MRIGYLYVVWVNDTALRASCRLMRDVFNSYNCQLASHAQQPLKGGIEDHDAHTAEELAAPNPYHAAPLALHAVLSLVDRSPLLQSLLLSDVGLGDERAETLCGAPATSSRPRLLSRLDLSGIGLGPRAGIALAGLIKASISLTRLDLGRNSVRVASGEALSDPLSRRP